MLWGGLWLSLAVVTFYAVGQYLLTPKMAKRWLALVSWGMCVVSYVFYFFLTAFCLLMQSDRPIWSDGIMALVHTGGICGSR